MHNIPFLSTGAFWDKKAFDNVSPEAYLMPFWPISPTGDLAAVTDKGKVSPFPGLQAVHTAELCELPHPHLNWDMAHGTSST